jgi:alginate O-acetyltransferase complex protein AlgI
MGGTILLIFLIGIKLEKSKSDREKNGYLLLSLVACLGVLFYFKYANFFADGLIRVLNTLGMEAGSFTLKVILPVGISFYTFQALSYVIDIKRGQIKATHNLVDFSLYISFFPQLVAGPIERGSHFLPQVQSERPFCFKNIRIGAWLILLGYFKKVVVADNCAQLANMVFNNPKGADGFLTLLGVYAFAFQIYGDFSGYSDIARGLARCFGFDLMVNFRRPYFATNPQDFWKRWHISLSTWLRDYLYIPLGGSRKGKVRTYINLFVTMLLGGLWHGANYNFILWGGYQGSLLVIHRYISSRGWGIPINKSRFFRTAWVFLFFQIICLGWVFFRVNGVRDIGTLAGNLIDWDIHNLWYAIPLILYAFPLILMDIWFERAGVIHVLFSSPAWLRQLLAFIMILVLLVAGNWNSNAFIYFQF